MPLKRRNTSHYYYCITTIHLGALDIRTHSMNRVGSTDHINALSPKLGGSESKNFECCFIVQLLGLQIWLGGLFPIDWMPPALLLGNLTDSSFMFPHGADGRFRNRDDESSDTGKWPSNAFRSFIPLLYINTFIISIMPRESARSNRSCSYL